MTRRGRTKSMGEAEWGEKRRLFHHPTLFRLGRGECESQ
jgi:hypothetical protein